MLIAGGALQGYVLTLLFWFRRTGDTASNRLLAALFLILTLYLSEMFLWVSGLLQFVPYLAGVTMPVIWLVGPIYLMYTRRVLDPGARIDARSLVHAIPAVLVLLHTLPWLLAPVEQRLLVSRAFAEGRIVSLRWQEYVKVGSHIVQNLVYVVWTHRLIAARRAEARAGSSDNSVQAGIRSLARINLGFAGLAALFVLLYAGFAVEGGRLSVEIDIYWMLGVVVFLQMHAYAAVLRPEAFAHRVAAIAAVTKTDEGPEPDATKTGNGKYARSTLATEEAARIRDRVLDTLRTEHLYREPSLTLSAVAARCNVSTHRLSQVLNQEIGKSFHELVNEHRVEEVKRLLEDPERASVSVLELGFEAGFNTKSSLYDAFRRFVGATPAAYRRGVVASPPEPDRST
ncbi:MAG: hypothetical protein DHS20C21_16960 [Gemmatimonadota bacterium]|nr:MAG: hypothetical protein DHS20C21_16960 [Gemmatimonadota bacterium]